MIPRGAIDPCYQEVSYTTVLYYFTRLPSPTTDELVEGGSATAIVALGGAIGADEDTNGLLARRTKI